MGRVAVSVSLGLALLLSGCSSGGEASNVTSEAQQETLEGGAYLEGPDIDAIAAQALDGLEPLKISESEIRCAITVVANSGGYNRSELQAAFSPEKPPTPFLRQVIKALHQCADLRTAIAATVELEVPVDLLVCLLEQISDETLIDGLVALSVAADLDEHDAALAEFAREIEPTACVED